MTLKTPTDSNSHYNVTIDPMLDVLTKAVHITLKRRKEGVIKGTKPDGSYITNGDYQSQQIIEYGLGKKEKQIAYAFGEQKIEFIGEEDLDGIKVDLSTANEGLKWIADPVDGTHGYSQDLNSKNTHPWAISIALVKEGKTVATAIYEASPNEYGNTEADRKSIDPTKPGGTFYWAHANIPYAHAIKGLNVNLAVTAPESLYRQEDKLLQDEITLADKRTPLKILAPSKLPSLFESLTVSKKNAVIEAIDPAAPQPDKTLPIQLDAIPQDNAQTGPHKKQLENAWISLDPEHFKAIDSMSAVASGVQAATGRTPVFVAARAWDWDKKGLELLLEKSHTPYKEYSLPGAGNQHRTMIIAGRDPQAFTTIDNAINAMRTKDGLPTTDKKDEKIIGDIIMEYLPSERFTLKNIKTMFGAAGRFIPGFFSAETPSSPSR